MTIPNASSCTRGSVVDPAAAPCEIAPARPDVGLRPGRRRLSFRLRHGARLAPAQRTSSARYLPRTDAPAPPSPRSPTSPRRPTRRRRRACRRAPDLRPSMRADGPACAARNMLGCGRTRHAVAVCAAGPCTWNRNCGLFHQPLLLALTILFHYATVT